MPSTRPILFAALFMIGFLLWQAWQQDYNTPPPVAATPSETPAAPGRGAA